MAGKGAAPRASTPGSYRVIQAEPAKQPSLPNLVRYVVDEFGEKHKQKFRWHPMTRKWWKMWGESPLAESFTANDWDELLQAAMLHSRYWRGDTKAAAELRIRVAKFGATPEDRSRLRIALTTAEEKEKKLFQNFGDRSRESGMKAKVSTDSGVDRDDG